MPMGVFHVLLGRPWKYDRSVSYDGRNNTYTYEKDGKKHTLIHLKEEHIEEQISTKVLLIIRKEFLNQFREVEV